MLEIVVVEKAVEEEIERQTFTYTPEVTARVRRSKGERELGNNE